MSGFILDTAAAVGDIVVSCISVSTDVVPTGPGYSKSRGETTVIIVYSKKIGLVYLEFKKVLAWIYFKMSTMKTSAMKTNRINPTDLLV